MGLYSDDIMMLVIKAIMDECDKISAVNYCRSYKIGFGERVYEDMYNNVINKIGSGKFITKKLERGQTLVAVCISNGKEGLVFACDGVYYRKVFSESEFKIYEEIKGIESFNGLVDDVMFSKENVDRLLKNIANIFAVVKSCAIEREFEKLKNDGNVDFSLEADSVDKISDELKAYYGEYLPKYEKKIIKFKPWNFIKRDKAINEKVNRECYLRYVIIGSRNKKGEYTNTITKMVRELIQMAFASRYFFRNSNYPEDKVILDPALVKMKAIETVRYNKEAFQTREENEYVAFVRFDEKTSIIFLIDQAFFLGANIESDYLYTNVNYIDAECYYPFKYNDISLEKYVDLYRINHVLDKIHRLTEPII